MLYSKIENTTNDSDKKPKKDDKPAQKSGGSGPKDPP